MQFHIPSVLQALPATSAVPDPDDPVDVPELAAGDADEATGLATGAALDACVGAADATGAEVAWLAADVGTVAKTPPGTLADEVAAFWVAVGEEAAAEDAPPVATGVAPVAPQDGPVGDLGVIVAKPNWSRESPGSGNAASVESIVSQLSTGMFATNMFGRALNAAVSRSIS